MRAASPTIKVGDDYVLHPGPPPAGESGGERGHVADRDRNVKRQVDRQMTTTFQRGRLSTNGPVDVITPVNNQLLGEPAMIGGAVVRLVRSLRERGRDPEDVEHRGTRPGRLRDRPVGREGVAERGGGGEEGVGDGNR